ncbi:hypothetical protein DID75_04030 [Candidatus Marinamargulisbacteria bacterium SCGC AG-410-N11]|nr:hypothetical protein DID75_04030 [Candidatus Marinamargulisbacteria bacterium SCGC AG-410-N11]
MTDYNPNFFKPRVSEKLKQVAKSQLKDMGLNPDLLEDIDKEVGGKEHSSIEIPDNNNDKLIV